MNRDGVMVIPPKFDDAGEFSNGLAPVTLAGRTGWTEEDKAQSCEGIPESVKERVATFPAR